jgi:hypothetical protein
LNTRERLEKEDGKICKMRRLINYNFLYILVYIYIYI